MSIIKDEEVAAAATNYLPKMVVSALAGWTTTYFLIKQTTGQTPEWAVRVVTALHAVVIATLAFTDWFVIHAWTIEQLGEQNTELEESILCLTLGYFCFDLLWVLRYQTEGPVMYLHHATSIISLVCILHTGISGREALVGISGLELTNPCLQARWFLRTYGQQGTWMHIATEIIFMVTFVVFRIFYGSFLTFSILTHPRSHVILKIGTLCLYVVSWAFVYQMISYLLKRYWKKQQPKSQ